MFVAVVWIECKLAMVKEDPAQKELEEGLLFEALEDEEELEAIPSAFEHAGKGTGSPSKDLGDASTTIDVVLR